MDIETAKALTSPKYEVEALLASEMFRRNLTSVLNKEGQAERFVQIGLNTLKRLPALKECSQTSFFDALLRLSQIDLEPDGYHAHLIPFWNNKLSTPQRECQLIIDYKGLVTIVRRSPTIAVVKGNVVRKGDFFLYEEGSERKFIHRPAFLHEDIIGAYSFVKFANINDWEVDYLALWEIEAVRNRSKAKDSGPWKTDFKEMAIKTALRHHCKTLPLRPLDRQAASVDDDQFDYESKALPFTTPKFEDNGLGTESTRESEDSQKDNRGETESPGSRATGGNQRLVSAARAAEFSEPQRSGKDRLPPAQRGAEFSEPQRVTETTRRRGRPVRRMEPTAAESGPGDRTPAASNSQEDQAGPPPSSVPAKQEPAPTDPRHDQLVSTLLSRMKSSGATDAEVIQVLVEHEILAEPVRSVADLPTPVIENPCIRQWASVIFAINKTRHEAEKQEREQEAVDDDQIP